MTERARGDILDANPIEGTGGRSVNLLRASLD